MHTVDNGIKEIYINSKNDDGSDIAELMKIFTNDLAYNDKKFPKISERKRLFKTTDKGVNTVCEIIERNRREAAEEAESRMTKNMVITMLKRKFKYEDIAEMNQITIDEVLEIGKQASIL